MLKTDKGIKQNHATFCASCCCGVATNIKNSRRKANQLKPYGDRTDLISLEGKVELNHIIFDAYFLFPENQTRI